MINPFKPEMAVVADIRQETRDTATYTFYFRDPAVREEYSFQPGQFNMLTIFGIGEVPVSLSSDPEDREFFQHTVRHVGNVTKALARLKPGDVVGVRGAYGRGWPMDLMVGRDVLVVAGGMGLASLRPVITRVLRYREEFGRVEVLYGASTPSDLLYAGQYADWAKRLKLRLTVEKVPAGTAWEQQVGPATDLLAGVDCKLEDTIILISGPEVMMRFLVRGFSTKKFSPDRVYLSLERRMSCGIKKCGKCQIGSKFTCQDGPVFSYAELLTLPGGIWGGMAR